MRTLAYITLSQPLMLLGLAGAVLPVIAHLMTRRARRRRVFPSIHLLAEATATQSRWFRLRRWLLLMLRVLAIALVAAAFAQPVWRDRAAAATGDHADVLVIVLDMSASMNQLDHGWPAMRDARQKAKALLRHLRPGRDTANVILAGPTPQSLMPRPVPNYTMLAAMLDEVEPTHRGANLSGAMDIAATMMRRIEANRRLVIISDMQWIDWSAPQLILSDAVRRLGASIAIVPVGSGRAVNRAVESPRAYPPSVLAAQPVRLSAYAVNHSDQPAAMTVQLSIDDAVVQQRRVDLPARAPDATPHRRVTNADHIREVVFRHTFTEKRPHRVTFEFTGDDDLAGDDRAYMVVHPTQRKRVVLLSDEPVDSPMSGAFYLKRALEAAPGLDVLVRRSDALGDVDASHVMVQGIRPWPASVMKRLANRLIGDMTMIFVDRASAIQFVEAMGGSTGSQALQVGPMRSGRTWSIGRGRWNHPILDVFDEPSRQALRRVTFDRVATLNTPSSTSLPEVLLWFDDGTPALVRSRYVLLAAFSPAPQTGDLGKHGIVVPLVQQFVGAFDTHDTRRVADRLFDVPTRPTRSPASPDAAPGFHDIETTEGQTHLLAVNADAGQSDLRVIDVAELDTSPVDPAAAPSVVRVSDNVVDDESAGIPLWPVMVLGALGLLGVELALLGYWKR